MNFVDAFLVRCYCEGYSLQQRVSVLVPRAATQRHRVEVAARMAGVEGPLVAVSRTGISWHVGRLEHAARVAWCGVFSIQSTTSKEICSLQLKGSLCIQSDARTGRIP